MKTGIDLKYKGFPLPKEKVKMSSKKHYWLATSCKYWIYSCLFVDLGMNDVHNLCSAPNQGAILYNKPLLHMMINQMNIGKTKTQPV